jgi:hypothetical protein
MSSMAAGPGRRVIAVLIVLGGMAAPVRAQSTDPSLAGRFEASAGGGWWGGYDLGQSRATLPGQTGATLYDAEAAIGGGAAATARFGWRFWRTWTLEGGATWARARLRSTVRSDIEPALNASLDTTFRQLAGELGLSVPLRRATRMDGRLVPFVSAGGGYLRQLYEDGVLLETGRLAYGGGGVRFAGREARQGLLKHWGLRADVRLVVRTGGLDVAASRRAFVTLTGGAFVRF